MPTLPQFLIVAAGGAIGACARFAAGQLSFADSSKFYITLLVNLIGCLLIGIAWSILDTLGAPKWISLLGITGILGGFTTFSSFSLEAVQLLASGRWTEGVLYVVLSVAGGIALCGAGRWLAAKTLALM